MDPSNCVIIAMSGATAGRSAINKIPLTTNQTVYVWK
jgi:type I restriction enzyme S subunit